MQFIRSSVAVSLAACVSACATPALTPSVETTQSLVTYEITDIGVAEAAEILVTAVKSELSTAQVQRNLAPADLPAKPGGIKVVNPLEGTSMAGLAALAGNSLTIPSCPEASVSVIADNTRFQRSGETTNYAACLWPYRDGLHMEIFSSYTIQSGGVSSAAIGRTLARSALGDSSQFIERTRDSIVTRLEAAGATVTETSRR